MIHVSDYKKEQKEYYAPKEKPGIIEVPEFLFVVIEGQGDPNEPEFGRAVEALYGFSYTVKMSYKSKEPPLEYKDYKVFPLEGVWDLVDKGIALTDKSNYKYRIMIRQPEFLTPALFERFRKEALQKKKNPLLENLYLERAAEGWCCQMLHVGSYDNEPESFRIMEDFCKEQGYRRSELTHREIYLSDPRRTQTEKLKTILRFSVEKTKKSD